MRTSVTTSTGRTYFANVTLKEELNVSLLELEDYVVWQDSIIRSQPDVYRIRRWGDPVMVSEGGLSVKLIPSDSNFQAVGLYNKANYTIGGVSNYLRIPNFDYLKLWDWQPDDVYTDKVSNFRRQKLNYLSGERGTIYFWKNLYPGLNDWEQVPVLQWGTIGLGGNLVTVDGIETLSVRTPDNIRRTRSMARLKGFQSKDWNRDLNDLLAEGLMHRAFGAYKDSNIFRDSPKGIVYTPFWSPKDWIFIGPGQKQPEAFYLPLSWLTK